MAKKKGFVTSIMDGPIENPGFYEEDVYFSVEKSDGEIVTIQSEPADSSIFMYQNVDGEEKYGSSGYMKDPTLEQFYSYICGKEIVLK